MLHLLLFHELLANDNVAPIHLQLYHFLAWFTTWLVFILWVIKSLLTLFIQVFGCLRLLLVSVVWQWMCNMHNVNWCQQLVRYATSVSENFSSSFVITEHTTCILLLYGLPVFCFHEATAHLWHFVLEFKRPLRMTEIPYWLHSKCTLYVQTELLWTCICWVEFVT